MSFMNDMQKEMLENFNQSITENGAIGYQTAGKNLLDINFAVASLRSVSEDEIIERFKKVYFEDKILAMKWLFYARDIREGMGERRLFRVAMNFVADYEPEIVKKLVPLVPEYGRFDDLWILLDNKNLCNSVLKYITEQLDVDITNYNNGKAISLLAKWLPSCNASSEASKRYSKIIRNKLGMTEKTYRKMLSSLRKYIDVVEVKMSSKQWNMINYENVPSRANLIYNDAFLRNDEVRRKDFLDQLRKGEAKINASTLYPHDIVHKYLGHYCFGYGYSLLPYDETIESLWVSLPNLVNDCANTIVVADGSGSMTVSVGRNTNISALEVADAISIYFSERSSGDFKDKYITFSKHPRFVSFSKCKSLRDKISVALAHNEVASTNVEAVFDLILNTAIHNNTPQEEIPANILIISDMEFDHAVYGQVDASLFKNIEDRYAKAGYKLPRLVFWNVNSRTNTIPIYENSLGVALVSGFSVNICKMVMSGKTDPFECLIETLNSKRYQPVEEALCRIL